MVPLSAIRLFVNGQSAGPYSVDCTVFFLLSGDIELNPGPTNFTLCTLNIRSILHPRHSAALSDLIVSHHPDLFCLASLG